MSAPLADGLFAGADGAARCFWCNGDDGYLAYHDSEWGRPVADDTRLYEKLVLEGFQAGLSWLTILRKRENFRRAFAGFDPETVARFGPADVERLVLDAGIIRHRGKIEAAISNARAVCDLIDAEGSLAALVWRHAPEPSSRPARIDHETVRALVTSPESVALAKALKARGVRFFGPTTAYAFMQSLGLVNDHIEGCHVRNACEDARAAFTPPG